MIDVNKVPIVKGVAAMMDTFDVRLFGRLIIRHENGEPVNLTSPKVQELFCYLVLQRDRPHPRETLLDLFWRNSPVAQARRSMRQALWQLQSTLAAFRPPPIDRFILASTEWIQVNPNAKLHTDVATFERAFNPVKATPGDHLSEQQACALERAVELYQGDLLEGWYQDWCLFERERLQNMFLAMLDKLMCYCDAQQIYDTGLGYGEQALRHDYSDERTHRRMMRLHYRSGNRAAALHQYQRCVAALRDELGVLPTERTKALYEQIRVDAVDIPDRPPASPTLAHAPSDCSLVDILAHLKQLWSRVSELEVQLQRDIQSIERAIVDRLQEGRG
jgi:DNA-binding SARP family transcriptional activator